MTIRVRIENQDQAGATPKRVVKVKRIETDKDHPTEEHALEPGESCEIHIWQGASLAVEEFEIK